MTPEDIPDYVTEYREIIKTVEVVAKGQCYIIEILLDLDGVYSANGFIRKSVELQPSYPLSFGRRAAKVESHDILVDCHLPWVHAPSVDIALIQALSNLSRILPSDDK